MQDGRDFGDRVEKHSKLKEDANIKLNIFTILRDLGLVTTAQIMPAMMDAIVLRHDMSGDEWDD